MAAQREIIEHIVLFNVKEGTDPSLVNDMVRGLDSLRDIDGVLYLTVQPVHRVLSTSSPPLNFTHLIHSRHSTKEDCQAYYTNPKHLGVVQNNIFPICDDILAVDWVAVQVLLDGENDNGKAVKLQALKLKEEELPAEAKEKLVEAARASGGGGIAGGPVINKFSFGDNFSPEMASPDMSKGYSFCLIGSFPEVSEVDQLQSFLSVHDVQIADFVDASLVVDYICPSSISQPNLNLIDV